MKLRPEKIPATNLSVTVDTKVFVVFFLSFIYYLCMTYVEKIKCAHRVIIITNEWLL